MKGAALEVNGREVPLNAQMQGVFSEVVRGLLRTLRGVEEPVKRISLEIEF